jgi:GTP diphosphokinase / guanosine-3',5'-bis(diphosphate) 3'-diphosphatase
MDNSKLATFNQTNKLHTFEEVKEKFYVYITNPASRKLVEDAYLFAEEKHKGIYRKSGEPYIHHLIEVCYILASLNCGPTTLAAGLLHDTVEDTDTTLDELRERFGDDVCSIVDSLTKIQRLKLSHREEDEFVAEDHRKIFLGMAKDVRVIVIKLADRLHNMRTVESLPRDRQIKLARETIEVFAPIAHRLGINTIKSELEDLSLKYLEPEKFQEISELVNKRIRNGQKSLESFSKRVADILLQEKIPFQMESRVKSIYSIYRKIYIKHHKPEEIFDLLAIRIITETELRCYEILGIIHATYTPIPGRFKDYIAMPKPNMYQSLHTCILSGDGNTFEVQIRTKDMDEVAESGIAAHWRYKEGQNYNPKQEQKEIEEKLHWLRDLVNISEEDTSDAKEYMHSLSHDIFEANVYCFTPKGKVIDLPAGSTPLDFAYKIHTGVAEKAVGAIVNNSMVSLNTVLKTGDIVEIKTSKTAQGPNENWLKIATTSFAKSHIRKFLTKKNADFVKDDKIARGKQACVETFRIYEIAESDMEKLLNDSKVLENYNASDLESLYFMVSNKNPTPGAIIDFLNIKPKETIKLEKVEKLANDGCPVYVKNAGSIAISLASCCTPIPGDDIIGYITKGKGITVHLKTCPNIANEKQRLIDVYWKPNLEKGNYPVDIKIECNDKPNLVSVIMNVFAQKNVPVTAINAQLHPSNMNTTVNATIYVANSEQLVDVSNALQNVKNVYEVTRTIH